MRGSPARNRRSSPADEPEFPVRREDFASLDGEMPARILIVDDEASIRRLVERTFQQAGYEVWQAESAAEGFDQAERCEPDLILLDILMPGGNGLELCRRIRTGSAVPIIL